MRIVGNAEKDIMRINTTQYSSNFKIELHGSYERAENSS